MTPTEEGPPTLMEPKQALNQLGWCYDMLGTNMDGDDQTTVRITLRDAIKALERDEKRRAALESEHSLMQEVIDEVIFNQHCNWCRKKQLQEATLRLGQFRLDALTPATQEKEAKTE